MSIDIAEQLRTAAIYFNLPDHPLEDVVMYRGAEEIKRLRRELDNIKVRSYELGQREIHDMALKALT